MASTYTRSVVCLARAYDLLTLIDGLVALAHIHLRVGYGDATQELSLVVCELVHRSKGDVEGVGARMVHSKNIDALAVVGELPASTTGSRVPSAHSECAADPWEAWERAEGGVTCQMLAA